MVRVQEVRVVVPRLGGVGRHRERLIVFGAYAPLECRQSDDHLLQDRTPWVGAQLRSALSIATELTARRR
jgi:hypothetical protein